MTLSLLLALITIPSGTATFDQPAQKGIKRDEKMPSEERKSWSHN